MGVRPGLLTITDSVVSCPSTVTTIGEKMGEKVGAEVKMTFEIGGTEGMKVGGSIVASIVVGVPLIVVTNVVS